MRLVLLFLWVLRWLPPSWVRALARALGSLLFHFGRRRITLRNLELCFPEIPEAERVQMGRRVFQNLARATLELGRLWYAPRDVALANIRLVDQHYYEEHLEKGPVILLAPHFVGLDFGGARVSAEYPQTFSIYSTQKNKVFDAALRRARSRFGDPLLVSRQDGLRAVMRALRAQKPFYYLPDMDFGARDALFVPFFGVPTATVTAMSRMAAIAKAKIVPCITRQREDHYEVRFYPAWDNYPSDDLEADTRRMNAFIEDRIREMPDQYFWVHKRFKTRPPGEKSLYK